MSRRTEKIAATLRRALQEFLARGLQDPRVKGLVTVTGVRVTEDLTTAFVSVSVMPEDQESVTLHGLRSAAGFIRRTIGDRVALRKLPTLEFQLDHSIKREAEVLAALDRVRKERSQADDRPESKQAEEEPR